MASSLPCVLPCADSSINPSWRALEYLMPSRSRSGCCSALKSRRGTASGKHTSKTQVAFPGWPGPRLCQSGASTVAGQLPISSRADPHPRWRCLAPLGYLGPDQDPFPGGLAVRLPGCTAMSKTYSARQAPLIPAFRSTARVLSLVYYMVHSWECTYPEKAECIKIVRIQGATPGELQRCSLIIFPPFCWFGPCSNPAATRQRFAPQRPPHPSALCQEQSQAECGRPPAKCPGLFRFLAVT